MGYRQMYLTFVPGGRHYFYYTGQQKNLLSVPEGDSVPIFQVCSLNNKYPWENSPKQKLLGQEIHGELLHSFTSHPTPVWLCPHYTTKRALEKVANTLSYQ